MTFLMIKFVCLSVYFFYYLIYIEKLSLYLNKNTNFAICNHQKDKHNE